MSAGETCARELIAALRSQQRTVAIAESCTGGQVLKLLTDVAGASACVWGGAVAYTAAAKEALTGLEAAAITRYGEVSAEVTAQLAAGIRGRSGVDVGAAVTGWAGPTSTGKDPVGTVYLAVVTACGAHCRKHRFAGSRSEVRTAAAGALLQLLLWAVLRQGAQRPTVAGGQAT